LRELVSSFISSHWQKSQVRRFSDCYSADFGPYLPANQLYNNQKINEDELETVYQAGSFSVGLSDEHCMYGNE